MALASRSLLLFQISSTVLSTPNMCRKLPISSLEPSSILVILSCTHNREHGSREKEAVAGSREQETRRREQVGGSREKEAWSRERGAGATYSYFCADFGHTVLEFVLLSLQEGDVQVLSAQIR